MGENRIEEAVAVRQRLDKWLFFARLFKSRSLAQKGIEGGDVRINGARVTQPSHSLKFNDIVTVAQERRDVIVRVRAGGHRRGPFEEARLLYADLTPQPVPGAANTPLEQATRERGGGRPTKKERRETDRLQPWSDWHGD